MIQLTTSFAITEAEFFASDGPRTNLINNIAALMGITDTSRIKIVGIKAGSVQVSVHIVPAQATSSDNVTVTQAQANYNSAQQSGIVSSTLSAGVGTLISVTSTQVEAPDYSTTTTTS